MLPCLVRQHKCELFHAPFSSLLSIALVYLTMFVYSITFLVYQPFQLGGVMAVSVGVKTRSSEKIVLPDEAHISLVMDSSSEEDSETDDQSYIPPKVYALSCNVYISHIMDMVSCMA